MNVQEQIHAFFNPSTRETEDNVLKPRFICVQSTVEPEEKYGYNEIAQNIHKQLKE